MSTLFAQNSVVVIIFTYLLLTLSSAKTKHLDDKQETQTLRCASDGDCLSTPVDCISKCGCDEAYIYNETIKECVLDVRHLMQALLTIYDPVDPNASYDSSMSAAIRRQSDKIFRGIIVAVIIFGSCALVCVISACLYCCRIVYSDGSLRGDVKALAKKLNRDNKIPKSAKVPLKAKAESCNVVVEDAGVFVC